MDNTAICQRRRKKENGVVVRVQDWEELGSSLLPMKLMSDIGSAILSQPDLPYRIIVETNKEMRVACMPHCSAGRMIKIKIQKHTDLCSEGKLAVPSW